MSLQHESEKTLKLIRPLVHLKVTDVFDRQQCAVPCRNVETQGEFIAWYFGAVKTAAVESVLT